MCSSLVLVKSKTSYENFGENVWHMKSKGLQSAANNFLHFEWKDKQTWSIYWI